LLAADVVTNEAQKTRDLWMEEFFKKRTVVENMAMELSNKHEGYLGEAIWEVDGENNFEAVEESLANLEKCKKSLAEFKENEIAESRKNVISSFIERAKGGKIKRSFGWGFKRWRAIPKSKTIDFGESKISNLNLDITVVDSAERPPVGGMIGDPNLQNGPRSNPNLMAAENTGKDILGVPIEKFTSLVEGPFAKFKLGTGELLGGPLAGFALGFVTYPAKYAYQRLILNQDVEWSWSEYGHTIKDSTQGFTEFTGKLMAVRSMITQGEKSYLWGLIDKQKARNLKAMGLVMGMDMMNHLGEMRNHIEIFVEKKLTEQDIEKIAQYGITNKKPGETITRQEFQTMMNESSFFGATQLITFVGGFEAVAIATTPYVKKIKNPYAKAALGLGLPLIGGFAVATGLDIPIRAGYDRNLGGIKNFVDRPDGEEGLVTTWGSYLTGLGQIFRVNDAILSPMDEWAQSSKVGAATKWSLGFGLEMGEYAGLVALYKLAFRNPYTAAAAIVLTLEAAVILDTYKRNWSGLTNLNNLDDRVDAQMNIWYDMSLGVLSKLTYTGTGIIGGTYNWITDESDKPLLSHIDDKYVGDKKKFEEFVDIVNDKTEADTYFKAFFYTTDDAGNYHVKMWADAYDEVYANNPDGSWTWNAIKSFGIAGGREAYDVGGGLWYFGGRAVNATTNYVTETARDGIYLAGEAWDYSAYTAGRGWEKTKEAASITKDEVMSGIVLNFASSFAEEANELVAEVVGK